MEGGENPDERTGNVDAKKSLLCVFDVGTPFVPGPHPNNCDAARKLEEARKKADELTAQYEAAYGPLHETSNTTSRWAWITGPWPWETGMEDDE